MTWPRKEGAWHPGPPMPGRFWLKLVVGATLVAIAAAVAFIVLLATKDCAYAISPAIDPHPTMWERLLVERALNCPNARRHNKDAFKLLALLRLEEHPEVQVPAEWRGMVLSAACNESGYSERAIGDSGRALGLLQLHKWHRRRCGLDDTAAVTGIPNALCWLWRVRVTYDRRGRDKCGDRRGWTAAWAWVAQGPLGYKCGAWSSGHMSRLRRWKRQMWDPVDLGPISAPLDDWWEQAVRNVRP